MEAKMKRLGSAALLAVLLTFPFGVVPASAANPPEQTLTSLPSGALPISDYYNQSVYDPQDNKIGDIKDLLVDKDGKIGAAIVGVGGFLGMGKHDVAIPMSQLKANQDGFVLHGATKDALKAMPEYAKS